MRTGIFEKIADRLIENESISAEDKELYEYGLRKIASTTLNVLTTFVIGFVLGMIWESIIFMLSYIPLRSYAGGYHARTPLRCYICSVILIVGILICVQYVPYNAILLGSSILVASIIIFIFAPFADENKPLDEAEAKVFRKRTRIILLTQIMLIGLFGILGLKWIAISLSVSVFVSSFMVSVGVVRKIISETNKCR